MGSLIRPRANLVWSLGEWRDPLRVVTESKRWTMQYQTNNPRYRYSERTRTCASRPSNETRYINSRKRRSQRSRLGKKLALILMALAAILAFGGYARGVMAPLAYGLSNIGITFPNLNLSTPSDQWKKGEMPYLYQTDITWAKTRYGAGTIETHGCGPTALDMAYVYLTGDKSKSPVEMAKFSEARNYLEGGITRWALIGEGARDLGLQSRELPADAGQIRNELRTGHPVICIVGPGDFTTDGHFIVLVSNAADGNVEIRDPNSPERSTKTWDLDRILTQTLNLWSLSL